MQQNIIIMGVCGSGKSTICELLATELSAKYYDGDDFHPEANVEKMAQGIPLTDADRLPWLEHLAKTVRETSGATVTACSALKNSYRDILRQAGNVTFIYLHGTKKTLLSRLTERSNNSDHFMPSSLLDSQLATLEEPNNKDEPDSITVSIEDSPEKIITNIIAKLS